MLGNKDNRPSSSVLSLLGGDSFVLWKADRHLGLFAFFFSKLRGSIVDCNL